MKPLVLSLPQVPDGVARVSTPDDSGGGVIIWRHLEAGVWGDDERRRTANWSELFQYGDVTVMREPRTVDAITPDMALTTLRAYLEDVDSFLQHESSAIFEALGVVERYIRDGAA